jgi:hypothetical protein
VFDWFHWIVLLGFSTGRVPPLQSKRVAGILPNDPAGVNDYPASAGSFFFSGWNP